MYWDVVEVKSEPGYSLFVRFKDGLTGRVQLRREELTGVLAPLLDVQFFEQVFIDCGAVAWPGEIDLAPDAMHAQVARQGRGSEQMGETDGEAMIRRPRRQLAGDRHDGGPRASRADVGADASSETDAGLATSS